MDPNLIASSDEVTNEHLKADFRADRPLRVEIDAIAHILSGIEISTMTCLDAGFPNPVGSMALRQLGGYWSTIENTKKRCHQSATLLQEEVLERGVDGEFPFDDKQFDVVVIGRGHLTGEATQDVLLIRECHRVLKTPGYLIVSGDYRKKFNIANRLARKSDQSAIRGYNEKEIFNLLKTGFDVLGVRTYCRFWSQLIRLRRNAPGRNKGRITAFLYRFASWIDALLILTKGYQFIAYGRRKGWRERQPVDGQGSMRISEAVLQRSHR